MDKEINDIEKFISMIENVGYKLHFNEIKESTNLSKLKTLETFVYKDFQDEKIILYKSISVYNGVLWQLVWRDYKQSLNEKTIPLFIKILKSQYNNRLRKVKIQNILNGTFEKSFDRTGI